MDKATPPLTDAFVPPTVLGTAELTCLAYQGAGADALAARIREVSQCNPGEPADLTVLYDSAIAAQLAFRADDARDLQAAALAQAQIFRVAGNPGVSERPLRVLALVTAGDLMTNTPLDFITNELDVRLDLLYLLPGQPLPPVLPDHDVAFFAISEADSYLLARLRWLHAIWPRPAVNNPRFLPAMRRDTLSRSLAGVEGVHCPVTVAADRATLESGGLGEGVPSFPVLIRPLGSHAGRALERVGDRAALLAYLGRSEEEAFYLSEFEDYAGTDGLYRKYRVAFIDRQPFLCHMAISQHWMVHYLNAGMTESAARREEERRAIEAFDEVFARRHAGGFAALHERLGFDYYSIDCAETRDGRLLVFEADTAAIVHRMDPVEVFPYKHPNMSRIFAAFGAMLRRRAACHGSGGAQGSEQIYFR